MTETVEKLMISVENLRHNVRERGASIKGVSSQRVAQEIGPLTADAFEMISLGLEAVLRQLVELEELIAQRLPENLEAKIDAWTGEDVEKWLSSPDGKEVLKWALEKRMAAREKSRQEEIGP